jgi:nucleotide-binding universal stress UspA family protein
MSAYRQILVPVDFSEHSQAALGEACELARRFGATLHLLHVNEPWPPSSSVASDAYPMYHEYVAQENARAAKALEALTVPDAGPKPVQRVTRAGHVEHEILKYIDDAGIDLVVIGTHGRTGIAHWIMGSVAERVVRFASCPVLVARQRAQAKAEK